MGLYTEAIEELNELKYICELYRFQGGSSFDYFDIKSGKFIDMQKGKFVYFSKSINHHQYFTIRRIRQLINNFILIRFNYNLCLKQLMSDDFYNICNLVNNSDLINNIYSIRLLCDSNYYELLKENSFYQNKKDNQFSIERVDRRVFGGGYGISKEWLSLMELLTFFNGYQKINRDTIISMLKCMRNNRSVSSINNFSKFFERCNYSINPNLFDDFKKYDIMNVLECIIDKKICNTNSELHKCPNYTIKTIINDYSMKRDKILKLID